MTVIRFYKSSFILTLSLFLSLAIEAQKKVFTQDQLLNNNMPEIMAPLPRIISWKEDKLILSRKMHVDSAAKEYLFDPETRKEIPYQTTGAIKTFGGSQRIVSDNNDLYLKKGNDQNVRLTNDSAREINPAFSPDSNYIAYTKNNNLYAVNIATQQETQFTFDGNDSLMNGYASWVYTEEILGRASRYRAFWWSNDSKHIAFFRTDDSPVPVFTLTDSRSQHGHVEKIRYPKAGDNNPEIKIGVVHLNNNQITWADFDENVDQYFGMPLWKQDGSLLALWVNRDQNDFKIFEVNINTGDKKLFYEEQQKTWVDMNDLERITFLKNGNILMLSDKSGWRQIYYHDRDGKLINPVTTGEFTVTGITHVDEKNKTIYFTARGIENTARIDLYSIRMNGKNQKRLTFGDYYHSIEMSPSGKYFITTYSNAYTPPRMALMNNKGKKIIDLGNSKGSEMDAYQLAKRELIRVKSDDGLFDLPAMVTWPLNMDSNKTYPVLISIYGGPDAGTVWDRWNFTANQQWYAREGLIQVAMDHRGSGHFGKIGLNYLHRNLGYWETRDYSTIVRNLIENGQADSEKICITGFSYGGYMSCYTTTYASDVFQYGMAGGSVTDWSLYDTHYTEKFMDTPQDNPKGYKSSSVLSWVDKYKGGLQLVHGEIDDNVHLQNTLQLVNKLQNLKMPFELMIYPGERHGWRGNKGSHFRNLKTNFIYRNLLDKEVPKGLIK